MLRMKRIATPLGGLNVASESPHFNFGTENNVHVDDKASGIGVASHEPLKALFTWFREFRSAESA